LNQFVSTVNQNQKTSLWGQRRMFGHPGQSPQITHSPSLLQTLSNTFLLFS